MDAPPDKEDCVPFIHVTQLLRNAGVNAPEILRQNLEQGFLLLGDLGESPYLDHLNDESADTLYTDAITALLRMQNISDNLPEYNEQRLRDEMDLFETWYLNRHLDITLNDAEKAALEKIFAILVQNAVEQPQVFVHRDYHSRNLMLVRHNQHTDIQQNPGVIDYQDAVIGPITYDLASLFKDCYIQWPRDRIEGWLDQYLDMNHRQMDRQQFIRWFDLMGVQRHLKVLGIFSRLNYRDGKQQYLNDLPLTLKYVVESCKAHRELSSLLQLLTAHVVDHPRVQLA